MTEFFDLEEKKSLMEHAAESLAGFPIPVNFRAPIREGYLGEAFKDANGMLVIDLLPVEDAEELYKVFLHELAHCLFHAESMEPRPAEIVALHEKGELVLPALAGEEFAEYCNDPQELEADGFANYFYEFSKRKAKFFYNEDSVKACLRVCANTTIQKGK